MKVLMLGWELPPHNSGGLGVACYQLCRALSHTGVDIEFVLPYVGNTEVDFMKITPAIPQELVELLKGDILQEAYDSLYYVPGQSRGAVTIHDLYQRKVATLVQENEYDIIHAHDWLTFRAALLARQISGIPIILHVHSIERDRAGGNDGNPLVREIEATSLLLADHIVAVSKFTRDAIVREYNIPADKIEVVHNSIDQEMIEPLDPTNAYHYLAKMKQQGYRVVANVGRLTIQKGLPNFIRAAQKVIAYAPKTLFLIVGSGDQYFELIKLSAELGIAKNVIFTGFLRGKQWRDSYSIADLFVMPSVSEPFGITPLEAIGYGTPTLISRQSGISEVLQNCLKVDYWDINKMVDQMVAVVTNDSLRDELHRNAFQEFQKMSWQPAAKKLLGLYASHQNVSKRYGSQQGAML